MNLEEKQDAAYKKAILEYLNKRVKTDSCLLAACHKGNKSLEGCINYLKQEAKKQAVNGVACIPDDEVYGWAVHYILEDSIKCEPENEVFAHIPEKQIKLQPVPVKQKKHDNSISGQLDLF
jgi:hypothetical protein